MAKTKPLTAEDIEEFKAKLLVRALKVPGDKAEHLACIGCLLAELSKVAVVAQTWVPEAGLDIGL